jgi:hypothetical protein
MSDPWVGGAIIGLAIAIAAAAYGYFSDRAFTRKYGPDPK